MRITPHSIAGARARRGTQLGCALAACLFFAVLAAGAGEVGAEEERVFYKYTDDAGRLHIVQSLDRVPAKHRNQIGKIELEGDPLWTKSAAQPPAKRSRVDYEPVKRRSRGRHADVVFYYADWCGYCKKARRWLDENGVAYDLRDVDISRYGDELMEVSGKKSVPVLIVNGEIIRGFNLAAYEAALGR